MMFNKKSTSELEDLQAVLSDRGMKIDDAEKNYMDGNLEYEYNRDTNFVQATFI